jgi:hypothetical protein
VVEVFVAQNSDRSRPSRTAQIGLKPSSSRTTSQGIGTDTSDVKDNFDIIVGRMQDAAHVLMTWLPIYQHAGYHLSCPKEVTVVLGVLPEIKKDLDRLAKKQIGRPPNVRREICAAVVVEAWKLIHGRPNARTERLYEACRDYWWTCGGKERGKWDDPQNWRRTVETALKNNHLWIEEIVGLGGTELAVNSIQFRTGRFSKSWHDRPRRTQHPLEAKRGLSCIQMLTKTWTYLTNVSVILISTRLSNF